MLAACETTAPTPTTVKPTTTTAKPTTTTAKATTTTAKPPTTTAPVAPSIGDRVWNDTDADGIQDSSEVGLSGVVVRAYVLSGPTRTLVSSKTTQSGWYRFSNLSSGSCYSLELQIPSGYALSPSGNGTAANGSDANSSGVTPSICPTTSTSDTDFGLVAVTTPPTTTPSNTTTTAPATTAPATTAPGTTVPPTTTPPSSDGWNLHWADEFNGSTLDTTKWTIDYNTYLAGNAELECYKQENVSVGSGALVLEARDDGASCGSTTYQPYTSGMIRTKNKFYTAFGRFEMRARFPKGKGLWPAFWTTSQSYPYGGNGRSGELDIVEVIGSRPSSVIGTAHWAYNGCGWGCSRYGAEHVMSSGDTADGFHTYAMEWEPRRIAWYFDGVKYYEIGDNGSYKWGSEAHNLSKTTDYDSNPLAAYPAPFDETNPQQLIVNLAVGGNWPGSPDSTTQFPAKMQVDYVRVYKR